MRTVRETTIRSQTIPQLQALGYTDTDILTTQVVDAGTIARYVDSIWNSCVPIPQPQHTGSIKTGALLAAGVHSYPEPACAIERVMQDDFVPYVVDAATKTIATVVPVSPRGSGDGRVRIVHTEAGNPLHAKQQEASSEGAALVAGADNPLSKAAFAKQQ